MKVTTNPYNENKVTVRTVALTPYQIYMEQVRGITESIRSDNLGMEHYPLQFGGLRGQRSAALAVTVVDIMDFQSKGNAA